MFLITGALDQLMNYFPFHIGDYKSATVHLSDLEDLAYRRLLDMYYDTEKPISLDTEWVGRRIRMDEKYVVCVLNDFFVKSEKGFSHLRCNYEIREYNIKAERSRVNGAKGGRRKAPIHAEKNPAGSQQDAGANPEGTQSLANQEPRTINQEPKDINTDIKKQSSKKKAKPEVIQKPEGLSDIVWDAWVKHREKKNASVSELVIKKLQKDGASIGWNLEQVMEKIVVSNWQGFDVSWIKPSELTSVPVRNIWDYRPSK